MTFLLLLSSLSKKSIRLEGKRSLVVKMQLYSTKVISVKFSSQDFRQKKLQNGFLLQILISHQISMKINVEHFYEILHVLLPCIMYIHSYFLQYSSFRTIYTCALNSRGGVEIDLTLTTLDTANEELHDPSFKGRGIIIYVLHMLV